MKHACPRDGLSAAPARQRRAAVVVLGSGHERRSSPWPQEPRRSLIAAASRPLEKAAELVAFFEARRLRLRGLRLRDPADFKSCAPSLQPAATDQAIVMGDRSRKTFALAKAYASGPEAVVRPLAKQVVGTVK